MSKELTKTVDIAGLTPVENKVYHASKSPAIKESANADVKTMLNVILTKANVFLGHGKNMSAVDFKVLVIDPTAEYLFQNRPFLRLEELSNAVMYGSQGVFKKEGEALYLSPQKIAEWIDCYLDQKKRPVMAKIASMKKGEEKPVDTKAVLADPDVKSWINDIKENMAKMAERNRTTRNDGTAIKPLNEKEMQEAYLNSIAYLNHEPKH